MNKVITPIYFVVFVLTAQFVLVNVVVAVLMKHLEVGHIDCSITLVFLMFVLFRCDSLRKGGGKLIDHLMIDRRVFGGYHDRICSNDRFAAGRNVGYLMKTNFFDTL